MKKLHILAAAALLIFLSSCQASLPDGARAPEIPESFSATVSTQADGMNIIAAVVKENDKYIFTVHEPDGLSGTVISFEGGQVRTEYSQVSFSVPEAELPRDFPLGMLVSGLGALSADSGIHSSYDEETEIYVRRTGPYSASLREDGSLSSVSASDNTYIFSDFVAKS
ncbi:MAG: hypothetical protein GX051_03890 [Clostridiales bacterium]|nr:hypothetical protein [Clostridiales bacterium]